MNRCDLGWAAVLAGGRSRRFGSPKALAQWDGEVLIGRIIRKLRESFDHVMIIADDPGLYAPFGCPVFPDPLPDRGPLAGLCSALEHCGGEYLFLTACDMPFLSEALIHEMRRRIPEEEPDIAAARNGGMIQTFQAYYRRNLLDSIDPASGRGLFSLFGDHRVMVIDPSAEGQSDNWSNRTFANFNCAEDLEQFKLQGS